MIQWTRREWTRCDITRKVHISQKSEISLSNDENAIYQNYQRINLREKLKHINRKNLAGKGRQDKKEGSIAEYLDLRLLCK